MTERKGHLGLITLAALTLPAVSLLGQSYGEQPQTLAVGAGAFQVAQPTAGEEGYIDIDGYLYAPGAPVHWVAPLYLPDGAVISQVCLYVNDPATGHAETVQIVEEELASGGVVPFTHNIAGVTSSAGVGYGYYCSPPTFVRIRSSADANNDGVVNPTSYWIDVSAFVNLGFGGVLITWYRSVSLPPAGPSFGDVPVSDSAFRYVEALAASGITSGCGGGNFCPDATLTRRQMAVFLAKALGLHWVD